MNSDQFAFWLKGFFELTNAEELTKEQVLMIRQHLDLCFNKVTPELGELKPDFSKVNQTELKRNFTPNQWDWTWRPEFAPTYAPDQNDLNRIYCSGDNIGNKLIC